MGYRSEVGYACTPAVRQLLEAAAEWDNDLKDFLSHADDLSSCSLQPDVAAGRQGRYRWSHVKWYEDYASVQAITNIMSFCDAVAWEGSLYGFVRIGEDYDDVEFGGDHYEFNLDCTRELDI